VYVQRDRQVLDLVAGVRLDEVIEYGAKYILISFHMGDIEIPNRPGVRF
jgi:hypothetical protein